jgi:hypothetical protein
MADSIFASIRKESINSSFTPQQLDQMRSMLDDPNVSAQDRNNFLYVLADAGRVSDAEIDRYAPQVGAGAADVKSGGDVKSNTDHAKAALGNAKQEQRAGQVKQNQADLQGVQNTLNQGGFSNSDQIIDEGVKGLKLFDEFYPLYQQAGGPPSGVMPAPGAPGGPAPVSVPAAPPPGAAPGPTPATYTQTGVDPTSLRAGMDEFRGIDFSAFHADAQTLQTAGKVVGDSVDALHTAWANTSDWTGDAKTAAEAVNNSLVKGAGALSQALTTAPGNISGAIDNVVMKNVVQFAESVTSSYGDGKIAGMSPQDVQDTLQAKENLPQLIDMINSSDGGLLWVGLLPAVEFMNKQGITFPSADVGSKQDFLDAATKLQTTTDQHLQQFVTEYSTKANAVHQQAATYVQAIDKNYSALIQNLSTALDPDPFAAATGTDSGPTTPSSSSGGPSGTSGSSGGSVTGGGISAPAAAPPPPPEVNPPTAAPPKVADGMNPVTGQPLETDPATGQPYPIDPKTGAALKPGVGEQETVKVQKGDNTIAMSEPDKSGKMDVAVDDGSGHHKDYKLDFGDEKTADGKTEDPADAKADGSGPASAAAGTAGGSLPGGKDGSPSSDGAYKPGADGKIHIQDGDLKITAERPSGADGPTVVTVDDGKGDPTKYTLDDAKGSAEGKADPLAGSATGGLGVTNSTSGAHHADSGPQGTSDSGHQTDTGRTGVSGAHADTSDPGSSAAQGSGTGDAGVSTQPSARSFATPGGLDLSGDLDTSGGHESAGGDVAGTGSSDSTTPAGADGIAAVVAAPGESAAHSALSAAFNLEPGAEVGSEAALPSSAHPESELGTAPGGMDPNAGQPAPAGAPPGGMSGMMGGMGGAGGGGGGDQQRSSSAYRVDGGIFESSGAKGRISGSLDDEGDRSISYDR